MDQVNINLADVTIGEDSKKILGLDYNHNKINVYDQHGEFVDDIKLIHNYPLKINSIKDYIKNQI